MADHLTRENEQLQLALNELRVLNDIATTISSTQPVEAIVEQIVIKCITHLAVEEATISLLEDESQKQEFHTMIRKRNSSATNVPFKLDNRLKGWMLKNKSILLSNDISSDDRFNFLNDSSFQFWSILCIPLIIKGGLIGYLAVFNKKNREPFSDQDRRLLSIIGSQSAQVIENARLYEEEKALLGLQEELRLARDIQLKLLPHNIPSSPGLDIAATNIPAKSVGGDYYDFITLHDEHLGFCIGDITGKGMPAAMLMANLQATFRSHAYITKDCCECLEGTNYLLYKSTESTKFATLFYGIFNPDTGVLTYANGGHDAPLLFQNNDEVTSLDATGLLLGVMESSTYKSANAVLKPGATLLLYTDGITEAMNKDGKEFGLDQLTELVKHKKHKSANEISTTILNAITNHSQDTPQSDDITLVILKKL